jgi:hypothetical protein
MELGKKIQQRILSDWSYRGSRFSRSINKEVRDRVGYRVRDEILMNAEIATKQVKNNLEKQVKNSSKLKKKEKGGKSHV